MHMRKSFAYKALLYSMGGMGSERACDSATDGPTQGNHLHNKV